jgi:hypothetical protein
VRDGVQDDDRVLRSIPQIFEKTAQVQLSVLAVPVAVRLRLLEASVEENKLVVTCRLGGEKMNVRKNSPDGLKA